MKKITILLLAGLLALVNSCKETEQKTQNEGGAKMTITIVSPAFEQGGMIPAKYTCDGMDISPALKFEGIPEEAKSIALIADDPDAPMGTWVHWVLFNLPAGTTELNENMPKDGQLPNGAIQGTTDFGRTGYGGPCPPSGVHRYYFKVYALNDKLQLDSTATKADVSQAMQGKILAEGQLMGKYKRQ